jgi:hypothetical protein
MIVIPEILSLLSGLHECCAAASAPMHHIATTLLLEELDEGRNDNGYKENPQKEFIDQIHLSMYYRVEKLVISNIRLGNFRRDGDVANQLLYRLGDFTMSTGIPNQVSEFRLFS